MGTLLALVKERKQALAGKTLPDSSVSKGKDGAKSGGGSDAEVLSIIPCVRFLPKEDKQAMIFLEDGRYPGVVTGGNLIKTADLLKPFSPRFTYGGEKQVLNNASCYKNPELAVPIIRRVTTPSDVVNLAKKSTGAVADAGNTHLYLVSNYILLKL